MNSEDYNPYPDEPERPDMDDLPHTEWQCQHCGAMNSCLDGECQFCDWEDFGWCDDHATLPCLAVHSDVSLHDELMAGTSIPIDNFGRSEEEAREKLRRQASKMAQAWAVIFPDCHVFVMEVER
jgi:hypothetical protein